MSFAPIGSRTYAQSAAEQARFELRPRCVSCGASDSQPLWSGRFNDDAVRQHLRQFHYAGNAEAALADAPFCLVQCRPCGMKYHEHVLTPQWLSTLYGEWIDSTQIEHFESQISSDRRHDARFDRGRQLCKHLLRLNELLGRRQEVRKLMDFGCGDGEFLGMASLFGFETYGVDFSITRAERQPDRHITIAATLDELDMVGVRAFDAITVFETLEHMSDPVRLLKALHSRLDDKGILIVEVPNCEGLSVPKTLSEFHALQPLEHINAFTPATLQQICERNGFVRCRKPVAHVTSRVTDLARSEAGRLLRRATTQQYFRKG